MPPRRSLLDDAGTPVRLGPELARGGEGVVFTLNGDADHLAKLYLRPPSAQTVAKLTWMVRAASPALQTVAAWPGGLLRESAGGPAVGFLMPRFHGYQPVHHLYNPAQRLKYFPRADWAFLAHAARNCAAAFDEVHRAGCLVGDVNQSNVLVSDKALVGLIDCDSFQVEADGRQFLCEVGVAHYTPPELQGRSFRGLVRTLNHDRFGLAVVLFQLLFLGRHPYAGRFLGAGELPFEQAIAEYRFAYSARARALQMDRPPHTPALADVPAEVGRLFERAFAHGSERPGARPSAAEWLTALEAFAKQLRPCPADPGHRALAPVPPCLWCDLASAGGPNYFKGVAAVATVFALNLARLTALLERIRRAAPPAFAYERAAYLPATPIRPTPLPAMTGGSTAVVASLGTGALLLAFASVVVLFVRYQFCCLTLPLSLGLFVGLLVYLASSPIRRELARRRRALRDAEAALGELEERARKLLAADRGRSTKLRRKLEKLGQECRGLDRQYEIDRQRLHGRTRELALAQYLKGQFLSDAEVPGIGPGRQQVLASYGIETADDISEERILAIKGFGPALTRALVAWREQVAAGFRFDPARTDVPEAELRGLVQKYRQRQDATFAELERGAADLEALSGRAGGELQAMGPLLRERVAAWAQAQADWQVGGGQMGAG